MERFWERFFYLVLLISQGSSFLNPRAYAILHRMHHAYSDTEKDPHSPHFFKDVFGMMIATKNMYMNYLKYKIQPEPAFQGNYPEWPLVDKIGNSWAWRIACGLFYIGFYIAFANYWWMYLLLPIHFLMGPLHGAIVNWCGHKYGYSNHDNEDHSKNSLPWDFLLMGELFQNNHHKKPNSPNFATKWWEFDPTYPVMKVLHWMKIIKIRKV
ncbi:stearoyl-CoA desaturase (delta-9 desaturase) [Pedobacter suwonensis]|uniref:Stearoyl-CoA desaturase (Delta-9 desaturase) n=2 Tax=Sphingobacteriaceae TaxID=84566 RepID=A0A1I0SYW3_9SPHI|nr:stearoyl-CoA desaturase (delta-9 desaturase) [Pedobacter suwonensis]